jgi:cytoskeleton protein RodZ
MSLGSMISKARKDAGLSIDDLSAATNIRGTLLREMEANNFSQCGGETYARGHLRNIAIKLNADPQIFYLLKIMLCANLKRFEKFLGKYW